ncbi:efflux RND transporter periplasmic adaptor subunit [Scopulibacillus cellulosilyticus]|uniref:Efflux RND transporter periplasmic adaptor subunit n=1 Tax=Scopulibacillus cellulosilyticus TaxID=2665665 RepID=A0ABW2PSJ4_9BACL
MKKKIWIWVIIAAVIIAFVGINILLIKKNTSLSKEELKTYKVREMTLTDSLQTSGVVIPDAEQKVYNDPALGTAKINVKEGQKVYKGMPLVTYDNKKVESEIEQLEINQEKLNIKVNEVNQKLDKANQELYKAQSSYGAENQFDKIKSKIESLETERELDNLDIKNIQSKINEAKDKQDKLTIKSNINGTVASISNDLKDRNNDNSSLVYVVSDQLKVKGILSEYEYPKVQKGTAVTFIPKAQANQSFSGTVASIGTAPEKSSQIAKKNKDTSYYSFSVELKKGSNKTLKDGFHVSISVPTKMNHGLVVPYQSIIRDGNKRYVIAEKENRLFKKQVTTGLKSDNYQEILTGLSKGDNVILDPDHKVASEAIDPGKNLLIRTFLKVIKADIKR